ncbi:MAG: UDP-3-O-(3-hydroxymyristoyl)glucosamine N-acyltransferase [Roseburia sp.]|uniref:DapH/DapD/GlmU-related protein n=1 Tax=Roseburia sp. 831b TaxID=1261635 RepID=UPI0009522E8C|nr:DapH/DapD/GlmU-related protein [Roseburia sp. 831b]MCI5920248.1 UDP-3-O-(3-hydroxymyristoyl)glucosamine N-acyltransferase [Roseburia sp.]WVK71994.1 DapH/DapD/GlmU-related protein [Roseburia sp. 831b]
MKLSKIVEEIDGKLIADGEFEEMNYCTAEVEKDFLTFMENPKFVEKISPYVTCIICTEELKDRLPEHIRGIFISEEPKFCFHKLFHKMNQNRVKEDKKTHIGQNCKISPMAVVAENNVIIGDNVTIEPFVMVNENVTIEDGCIIHSNVVIGGRSFSEARSRNGEMCGLDNMGNTVIEKNVEIMSGTHIAQGIWKDDITHIGENSRIDAMCHIGHGVSIGNSVLIAAGAVIGGNTRIGDNAWVGINATVSNRLKIGENARVSLGAVVTKDVEQDMTVTGNFAIEHRKFIEQIKENSRRGI